MADVTVQLTIPEAAVPKVVDAFTKAAGARIDMSAHKSTETKEFNANWNYSYAEQGDTETAKQFAVRVITEQIKALVRMVDYAEDQDRYRTAVSAIPKAEQDVPDNIITGV